MMFGFALSPLRGKRLAWLNQLTVICGPCNYPSITNCDERAGQLQRQQLFDLLAQLDKQIKELEAWLEAQANVDEQVKLLRTQKGVGVLTALCVVNTVAT